MEEDLDDSSPDEYYYYNDDEDDEDCGFWDGVTAPGTYCGFRPSFLYNQDYNLQTGNYITREQADKNAEELLQEEKREKEKADKKRLKKKRQKDRRRQQRLQEEESLAPAEGPGAAAAQDTGQEETGEPVTEDDLDLGSTFVRQAQKKMENKPKPERKGRSKEKGRDRPQESAPEKPPHPTAAQRNGGPADQYKVQESMDLANIGNNLASRGSYMEALHYYTEAIGLNPGEYRFLGNRSYSYERLGRYKEALQDAEKALEMEPHFIKGHYRKGKALKGLKRYLEAITAFQRVLSCDLNRVEATQEIADCQQKLQVTSPITQEVPVSTSPAPPNQRPPSSSGRVFVPRNLVYTRSAPQNHPTAKTASSTLYPVWVGNVTSRITEEVLRSLFAAFGAVHSLRILYSRTCAFVNFTSKEAAESAFRALQGLNVEGTTFILQLRNPEHKNLNPGGTGAKNTGD